MKKLLISKISIILTCALIFSNYSALAITGPTQSTIVNPQKIKSFTASSLITKEEALIGAKTFIKNSPYSEDLHIKDISNLYDLEENIVAYEFTFEKDGKPSGYVIISTVDYNNPIIEYSFEGGSIYEETTKDIKTSSTIPNLNAAKKYYCDPFNMHLGLNSTQLLDISTGKIIVKNSAINEYRSTYSNLIAYTEKNPPVKQMSDDESYGILSWETIVPQGEPKKIANFGSGTEYCTQAFFGDPKAGFACAPTAACNCLWYYNRNGKNVGINRNYTFEDQKLQLKSICSELKVNMRTTSSGTAIDNVAPGLDKYVKKFKSSNSAKLLTYGNWNTTKGIFDRNHPAVILGIRGVSGHAVMGIGYAKGKDGNMYVFCMDGVYLKGRFMRFSGGYFNKVGAIEVIVN